jgi:hypothetical protein
MDPRFDTLQYQPVLNRGLMHSTTLVALDCLCLFKMSTISNFCRFAPGD